MRTLFRLQLALALPLAALLALPPVGPARAQPGDAFAPAAAPPVPPPFAAPLSPAPRGGPAPDALVCAQLLDDPAVSAPASDSPWRELRDDRDFAADQFFSAPQSIRMVEDEDSFVPSPGDVDGFGQTFAVPEGAELLYGSLRYRVSGAPAPGEQIEVALYAGDSLSAERVALFSAPTAGELNTWRSLDWELADGPELAALRASGQALLVVTLRSAAGAAQQLWADEIRASGCSAAATVSGRVTQRSQPDAELAGARILLVRSSGSGQQVLAETSTDAAGAYRFAGVPALAAGERYQIWYLNAPAGADRPEGRIGFWAGPSIASLGEGQPASLAAFDIGDVALSAPASYTTAAARAGSPARLTWQSRGEPGERYQLCLYDPARLDPATGRPAQLCGPRLDPARDQLRFDLTPQSFAGAPQFGFSYGRSYRWYVVAMRLSPSGAVEQYGYSFYERAITLVPQAEPAPVLPSADEPGPPAAPAAAGDWTLLVYAAGDNALGDPRRTPGVSRLDAQLGALAALAPRYPGLRIVTYADLYGDTGAALCYLRPAGGPDCRRRAEPDSADPATLREFVTAGLQRYPARRAMLLLIGPGHAVAGFGPDETTPGTPALSADQIGAALRAARAAARRPIDLLALRAPLMGELSALTALQGAASFAVAASDQVWQVAWAERLLPLLSGPSKDNPRSVAIAAVSAYDAAVTASAPGRARSMAAYDLARAGAAQAALDELGAALSEALDADSAGTLALLAAAREAVQRYDSSGNGLLGGLASSGPPAAADEDAFFDAAGLASSIGESPLADVQTKAAAQTLGDATVGAAPLVLASVQRSGLSVSGEPIRLSAAGGLAIFLPGPGLLGGQRTLAQLALYEGGRSAGEWAGLLRRYLGAAPPGAPGGVTAGPTGGARFAPPTGGTIGVNLWLPVVGAGAE